MGVPIIRTMIFWGSILGSLFFGKLPFRQVELELLGELFLPIRRFRVLSGYSEVWSSGLRHSGAKGLGFRI